MPDGSPPGPAPGPTAPEPPAPAPLLARPAAWAVLLAVYIALGVTVKSVVLNWIVGPLFPLVFLHLVPRAFTRRPEPR